jgi:hypothetical protein
MGTDIRVARRQQATLPSTWASDNARGIVLRGYDPDCRVSLTVLDAFSNPDLDFRMASRKALDIDAARADQRSGALPTVIKTYRLSSPREAVNTSADSPPGLQPAFCACPSGFRQQAVFSRGGLGRRELAVLFEFHLGCMIATPMASVAFRASGHLMNLRHAATQVALYWRARH